MEQKSWGRQNMLGRKEKGRKRKLKHWLWQSHMLFLGMTVAHLCGHCAHLGVMGEARRRPCCTPAVGGGNWEIIIITIFYRLRSRGNQQSLSERKKWEPAVRETKHGSGLCRLNWSSMSRYRPLRSGWRGFQKAQKDAGVWVLVDMWRDDVWSQAGPWAHCCP